MSVNPLVGINNSSAVWCLKINQSNWIDLALIISGIAALAIGIVASTGGFEFIGTTNAAYLSYGMYGGAALLLATTIVRIVRNCYVTKTSDDQVKEKSNDTITASNSAAQTTQSDLPSGKPPSAYSLGAAVTPKLNEAAADKQTPVNGKSKKISYQEESHFLNLPPEMQLMVAGKLDSSSLISLSATNKFLRQIFLKQIIRERLEKAALTMWKKSLNPSWDIQARTLTKATISSLPLHADFILAHIKKTLDKLDKKVIPTPFVALYRIAESLQGLQAVSNSGDIKLRVKQVFNLATQFHNQNKITDGDKDVILATCIVALSQNNKHSLALQYFGHLKGKVRPYALMCIAESCQDRNVLEALDYMDNLDEKEKNFLLCTILNALREAGKAKTGQGILRIQAEGASLQQAQYKDEFLCELAASFLFIGDFNNAYALIDQITPSAIGRFFEILADQVDLKSTKANQILNNLLTKFKEIGNKTKNFPNMCRGQVAIAKKMTQLQPLQAKEIWSEGHSLYKENSWFLREMATSLALNDIQEALVLTITIADPSEKIIALINVAKELSSANMNEQAVDVFESAILECSRLARNCRIKTLLNIVQHYAMIAPERAKKLFLELTEVEHINFKENYELFAEFIKACAIYDPRKCMMYLKSTYWITGKDIAANILVGIAKGLYGTAAHGKPIMWQQLD